MNTVILHSLLYMPVDHMPVDHMPVDHMPVDHMPGRSLPSCLSGGAHFLANALH